MKTNKLFIGLLLFIFNSKITSAQITFQKTFGDTLSEWGFCVQQTSDSGYIISGVTESNGAGIYDVYLIKTDASANIMWNKTFGGFDYEYGLNVQQTTNGGCIIVGFTQSFGAGGSDVYLIRTDSSGNILWSKSYGGTSSETGYSIQQTDDGGFIFCGETTSFGSGGLDVYVIKTDTVGNIAWSKTFGGSNTEQGFSILNTNDGGYIISASTYSFGAGGEDVYLIKISANGSLLWSKTFGGTGQDEGSSVQQTLDMGYIITGYTESFGAGSQDVLLIKTDSSGNYIWSKTFGGTNTDRGYTVQQTNDNGYIICGKTWSFGAGGRDMYLIKTDLNGSLAWSKTYGGVGEDDGWFVKQTLDGGYIITGETGSFGAGVPNVYLVKTDSYGNSGCNQNNTITIDSNPLIIATTPGTQISFGANIGTPPTQISTGGTSSTLCYSVGTGIPNVGLYSSDTSFCDKHCIDFFDLSTNNPTSWQWSFPGADSTTSALQNPTNICYSTYGSFDVTLIACNVAGCDTLILLGFINEYPLPTATITQSNDTLFSSPGVSYQWYSVATGSIAGAINNYFVPTQTGDYYVIVTDSIGCAGTSNVISITGINQISNFQFPISIIPNPNNGSFTISLNELLSKDFSLRIINSTCQSIKGWQSTVGNRLFSIDVNTGDVAQGLYVIEIINNNKVYRVRFVVQ